MAIKAGFGLNPFPPILESEGGGEGRLFDIMAFSSGGMALIRVWALIRGNTVYFDHVSRACLSGKCTALLASLVIPGISRSWPRKLVS